MAADGEKRTPQRRQENTLCRMCRFTVSHRQHSDKVSRTAIWIRTELHKHTRLNTPKPPHFASLCSFFNILGQVLLTLWHCVSFPLSFPNFYWVKPKTDLAMGTNFVWLGLCLFFVSAFKIFLVDHISVPHRWIMGKLPGSVGTVFMESAVKMWRRFWIIWLFWLYEPVENSDIWSVVKLIFAGNIAEIVQIHLYE